MAIVALILAAGQSRRMGGPNKLLETLAGRSLLRHTVDAALASKAISVLVVTGHQAAAIRAELAGLDLTCVHNPDYADGLSTSLKTGIAALPEATTGVLVMLGDMPFIKPVLLDTLIDAFEQKGDKDAAVPVTGEEWGNPVLLGRSLFATIADLNGDAGARKLLQNRRDCVLEVPIADEAVLIDLDTPEALAKARGTG